MTTNPDDDQRENDLDEIQIDLGAIDVDDEEAPSGVEIDLSADEAEEDEPEDAGVQIDLGLEEDDDTAEPEPETDDLDEALEQAIEAKRDELAWAPGDWYVLHTYSGMENKVRENVMARAESLDMEDYIFEALVPTEEAIEIRNGQEKLVTRVHMPGYILVRMDMEGEGAWSTVRHTPSVTGFVGYNNQPIPLGLDEVLEMLTPSIKAQVAADNRLAHRKQEKTIEVVDFADGDAIMVIDGPFTGLPGTLVEINANRQSVKAMVEIMGRDTPVDLNFAQIQKVV